MRRIRIFALVACLLATPAAAQNKVRPGLGDDPGPPETTPFAFPPGVSLAGPIWGADADGGECPGADVKAGAASGGVKVCVPLRNTGGGGPGPVEFNDGLILISEHQEGQNGMLVERVRVEVPGSAKGDCLPVEEDASAKERRCTPRDGDPDSVFIVELGAHCLNASLSPSFAGMSYAVAGITSDPDLQALLALLATKDLSGADAEALVTDAIHEITEGDGLTPQTRRKLQALPPRRV